MWTPSGLIAELRVKSARRRLARQDEQGANTQSRGQPRQSTQMARRTSPAASSHKIQRSSVDNDRTRGPDGRLVRTHGRQDLAYSAIWDMAGAVGTRAEDQKQKSGFIAGASRRVKTVKRFLRWQKPHHEGGLLDPPSVLDLPRRDTSLQARSIRSHSSHASIVSVSRPRSSRNAQSGSPSSRRRSRDLTSTGRSGDQRSGEARWSDVDLTASGELVAS